MFVRVLFIAYFFLTPDKVVVDFIFGRHKLLYCHAINAIEVPFCLHVIHLKLVILRIVFRKLFYLLTEFVFPDRKFFKGFEVRLRQKFVADTFSCFKPFNTAVIVCFVYYLEVNLCNRCFNPAAPS